MIDTNLIKPHMSVVCSKDKEFAKVDHIDGQNLKLAKDPQGEHHFIPLSWVKTVDDKVHVDRPGDEVMRAWTSKPS